MYFLEKQTPWGMAGLGNVDLSAEQWQKYMSYGADQLTYYVNAAGGFELPLDGQFSADKLAALFSLVETNLPAGKTLASANAQDVIVAMGFTDPDLAAVVQGILEPLLEDERIVAYASQTSNMYIPGMPSQATTRPWWHWALIVGGSVLGGGIVGAFVGYYMRKR